AAEMYAPLTGKIAAVNEDLGDNPALVNQDPYGRGWIVKIEFSDSSQLDDLLDAAAYKNHIELSE
ncbi:MAG: glycine cleavage system protein H, partial [Candidatus Omnitrophica bacterium]|nr:glycine cleavage system protein H [Candidatus Omnitrophota bacterium]